VNASGQRQIRLAPTGWVPVVTAPALLLFASVTRAVWPQILGCALAGLVGASLLALLRRPKLDVSLDVPDHLTVGKPFDSVVRIRNLGRGSSRPVVVRHRCIGKRRLVPNLAVFAGVLTGRDETFVRVRRTPVARGVVVSGELEIDAVAPFGFFTITTILPLPTPLLVGPAIVPALAMPASTGSRNRRSKGPAGPARSGLDPRGARAWQAGDEARQVAWRSTARTGRLTVIEREVPGEPGLVVLLAGRSGDKSFERAIALAAATAAPALRRGTATYVVGQQHGARNAPPLRTERALLECLARVEVAEPLDDGSLRRALQLGGEGGAVLLVAGADVPVEWLSKVAAVAVSLGLALEDLADLTSPVPAPAAPAAIGAS
jgi:uncharacterized protein (DUF58 family)